MRHRNPSLLCHQAGAANPYSIRSNKPSASLKNGSVVDEAMAQVAQLLPSFQPFLSILHRTAIRKPVFKALINKAPRHPALDSIIILPKCHSGLAAEKSDTYVME